MGVECKRVRTLDGLQDKFLISADELGGHVNATRSNESDAPGSEDQPLEVGTRDYFTNLWKVRNLQTTCKGEWQNAVKNTKI